LLFSHLFDSRLEFATLITAICDWAKAGAKSVARSVRVEIDQHQFGQIFLDLENPRHEPFQTESEVIDWLCRNENILPLAKDIAENGLNELEIIGLIPDENSDDDAPAYFVAEGNRRVCALKLLLDPDRAPAKLRKGFEQIATGWSGMDPLQCALFEDREAIDIWLSRIHDGQQGGLGRSKWDADQSQRHSGAAKNKVALHVLDYAEEKGLITKEGRKGKLTTVTRYLTKKPVQEAFGLDVSDLEKIRTTKSEGDFDMLLGKFVTDLQSGHAHSRANGSAVFKAYGRELDAVQQAGDGDGAARLLRQTKNTSVSSALSRRRRSAIKPHATVPFDHEINDALKSLNNQKLTNLYNSITMVPLQPHAPLVSIGAWAFIESLSAKAGRNTQTDFLSFFSKSRLQSYGVVTGKGDKAIAEALRRVSASGDVSKHDATAALFNGEQLVNDLNTLRVLIVKCVQEAASQP
jgi:hypothetical protein